MWRLRGMGLVHKLAIRRCVGGGMLACGCTAGLYETFGGRTLAVIDARAASCASPDHKTGSLIEPASLDGMSGKHLQARRFG